MASNDFLIKVYLLDVLVSLESPCHQGEYDVITIYLYHLF